MATLYYSFFMQCKVQSGYSERACSFIDQRLLAPVQIRPGNDMDYCALTGFEV